MHGILNKIQHVARLLYKIFNSGIITQGIVIQLHNQIFYILSK